MGDVVNWIFDKIPSPIAVPVLLTVLLAGIVIKTYLVVSARGTSFTPVIVMALGGLFLVGGGAWYLIENPLETQSDLTNNYGGKGGSATVVGNRSGAEGGVGGKGGVGPGGDGGNAEVYGSDSFARGGDGGNAGTADGRGGRRTLSQGERLNLPTRTWPYGYGGAGANTPEYDRRLEVLTELRAEYLTAFPDDARYINVGIDPVPVRWINKRLEELGESWRVELEEGGYAMPPLRQP